MKSWIARLVIVWGFAFGSEVLADEDFPKGVRIHVMSVEMGAEDYTAMMRRGKKKGSDYAVAMELVKVGKGRIQDVNVVSGRPGEKFTLEGVREEIYGSDYDPPGGKLTEFPFIYRRPFMAAVGTTFETRNTGMTLEVEPTFGDEEGFVDLRFAPSFVVRRGFSVWVEWLDRWGRSDVKFPIYDVYRVNTGVTLRAGEFLLSHLFTPKGEGGELDGERKVLVFVMAEVVELNER